VEVLKYVFIIVKNKIAKNVKVKVYANIIVLEQNVMNVKVYANIIVLDQDVMNVKQMNI